MTTLLDRRLSELLWWGIVIALTSLAIGCSTVPDSAQRQADDAFAAGVNRAPTHKTLYAMARVLASQGRERQCEQVLFRALKECPTFLPAYCALAESQLRQRRVEDALATLRVGLTLAPNEPVLLNDAGMCQLIRGNYAEALAAFEEASAAAPAEARYTANCATALGMLGRYDEALATYLNVLTASEAHYNLAVLCEARQDKPRAETEFREAQAQRDRPTTIPVVSTPAPSPPAIAPGSTAAPPDRSSLKNPRPRFASDDR